ncbi:MAG: VOC family protein [Proteobacteria bacterium]|nr:VOC family protein [Pseudomonadota bacterium]MDA1301098.1 VOC family protein [Pseudomonadota bacterium]
MADFKLNGINHLALVCADMDVTVAFYTGILGMKLTKTLDLSNGQGKHFFFDAGNGDAVAFFWFPDGPGAVSSAELARITATPGTMNHVAFDVSPADIETYRDRLRDKGVEVTDVVNHADTETGVAEQLDDTVFVRSLYFRDPDGTLLEFAAWTRAMTPQDVDYPNARAPATKAAAR